MLRTRALRGEPFVATDDPQDHKSDILPAHRRQRDSQLRSTPFRPQQDAAETGGGGHSQRCSAQSLHGGSPGQQDIEQRGQRTTGNGMGDKKVER